jgi:hypothetical protein
MNRIITIIMLGLLCSTAQAGWQLSGKQTDGSQYYDLASRTRDGNIVKMWSLYDYFEPQIMNGYSVKSWMLLEGYDCSQRKSIGLKMIFYTGPIGQGQLINSIDLTRSWADVAPGTRGESLFKIACTK